MGIFSAMNTAVTGLSAQSTALEYISNNIANSQTVGYKRTESTFAELVQESSPHNQALGVVAVSSRATNDIQGQTQPSDVTTHMSINGDGYFIVSNLQSTVDGEPIFNSENLYTRRGDFELNADGYLVNSAGYYLKGLPINPTTGNVTGSVPELVHVAVDEYLPAKGTSVIDYTLNLPSTPTTANYDKADANSELLDPTGFTQDPTDAGTGIVIGTDAQKFIDNSISGGSVTAYTATGVPANIEFRWAKTDSVDNGGSDTWELFYLADTTATGAETAWVNSGQQYVFGTDGLLNPSFDSLALTGVTVDGVEIGDVTLDHSDGNVTQYATVDGAARTSLKQNGYIAGEFVGLSLSTDGRLVANYANGRSISIAELPLANFASDGNLAKVTGGAWRETSESGSPVYSSSGSIVGEALESSNTDIADEFSKLIITQQAYAANTRIVTTGDQMMQEVLSMIR